MVVEVGTWTGGVARTCGEGGAWGGGGGGSGGGEPEESPPSTGDPGGLSSCEVREWGVRVRV